MSLTLSRAPRRTLANPSLVQFLSPSSSISSSPLSTAPPGNESSTDPQPPAETKPPPTSFLDEVKPSLKQQEEKRWPQNPTQSGPNSLPSRNLAAGPYLGQTVTRDYAHRQEIRKNLSEFRQRSFAPPPAAQGQQRGHLPISFQQLYERNAAVEGDGMGGAQSSWFSGGNQAGSGINVFEHLKASLKGISKRAESGNRGADSTQSGSSRNSFYGRAPNGTSSTRPVALGGGTVGGPASFFGMTRNRIDGANEIGRFGSDFRKEYSYKDLGELLKKLRPALKQGQKVWFSLQELSERLSKLSEVEKEPSVIGIELKETFNLLARNQEEKNKVIPRHRSIVLSQSGATPDYQSMTPKEHLVEKYFHPDNMSSREKMKLELAQVREEFKMSESDCGSARVQVALLTTKIKHLSSVLHKKDKHSRKGLQEMVQKRKKLLKYLRRTDWDSFCIVLSKLGLRDNPDYKNF